MALPDDVKKLSSKDYAAKVREATRGLDEKRSHAFSALLSVMIATSQPGTLDDALRQARSAIESASAEDIANLIEEGEDE